MTVIISFMSSQEISNQIKELMTEINTFQEEAKEIENQINFESFKVNDLHDEITEYESRISLLAKTAERIHGNFDQLEKTNIQRDLSTNLRSFAEIEEEIEQIKEREAKRIDDNNKATKINKANLKEISMKLKEIETILQTINKGGYGTHDLASIQLHFKKEKIPN